MCKTFYLFDLSRKTGMQNMRQMGSLRSSSLSLASQDYIHRAFGASI